jgi:hypothetical protein
VSVIDIRRQFSGIVNNVREHAYGKIEVIVKG